MNKKMTMIECLSTLSKDKIDALYNDASDYLGKKVNHKETLNGKKKLIEAKILSSFQILSLVLTHDEESQLKKLINGEEVKNISDKLLDNYLVFKIEDKDKAKYVVPLEIENMLNFAINPRLKKEKELMVVTYYVESNGVIEIDKLLELIKKTGINLTKNKLISYLKESNYIIEDGIVYIDELPKKMNIHNYKKENDYKVFTLEEIVLLNFDGNKTYNEKIYNILSKYKENPNGATAFISNVIGIGFDYKNVINKFLQKEKIKFNSKDKEEFDNLIRTIYLHTPSWELNGYCPIEFMEDEEQSEEELTEDYIYAYLLINGAMFIGTLLKMLEEEHNIKLTEKELRKIVKLMDDLNILNDCITIKGIDEETLTNLMLYKSMQGSYKVIDDLDSLIDEDFENVSKIAEICSKFELDEFTENDIISFMNFGKFNKEIFDDILKEHNIKMDSSKKLTLYKKINDVFNNSRMWILNGFKKSEIKMVKKKTKIG